MYTVLKTYNYNEAHHMINNDTTLVIKAIGLLTTCINSKYRALLLMSVSSTVTNT